MCRHVSRGLAAKLPQNCAVIQSNKPCYMQLSAKSTKLKLLGKTKPWTRISLACPECCRWSGALQSAAGAGTAAAMVWCGVPGSAGRSYNQTCWMHCRPGVQIYWGARARETGQVRLHLTSPPLPTACTPLYLNWKLYSSSLAYSTLCKYNIGPILIIGQDIECSPDRVQSKFNKLANFPSAAIKHSTNKASVIISEGREDCKEITKPRPRILDITKTKTYTKR